MICLQYDNERALNLGVEAADAVSELQDTSVIMTSTRETIGNSEFN